MFAGGIVSASYGRPKALDADSASRTFCTVVPSGWMPFLLAASYADRSDFVFSHTDCKGEFTVAVTRTFADRRQSE
jgi:hypothetical protein